ncbi:hypothetical protein HIM_02996 [Hirsutella minnesotensis 3608]|nr:hypothetical protein HIM_02996 [Hirsutella minnesotensis 3608]
MVLEKLERLHDACTVWRRNPLRNVRAGLGTQRLTVALFLFAFGPCKSCQLANSAHGRAVFPQNVEEGLLRILRLDESWLSLAGGVLVILESILNLGLDILASDSRPWRVGDAASSCRHPLTVLAELFSMRIPTGHLGSAHDLRPENASDGGHLFLPGCFVFVSERMGNVNHMWCDVDSIPDGVKLNLGIIIGTKAFILSTAHLAADPKFSLVGRMAD